jgi:hypothetical protein
MTSMIQRCTRNYKESAPRRRLEGTGIWETRVATVSVSTREDVGFWVVTPCGLTGRYRRFGRTYSLLKTANQTEGARCRASPSDDVSDTSLRSAPRRSKQLTEIGAGFCRQIEITKL